MTDPLQLDDLSVYYGSSPAAQNVSMTVRQGSVMGVIGESGSGKTSVAMAILGLLPQTARVSGRILLEGETISGLGPRALRQVRGSRLGSVIQNASTSLDPTFSIGSQFRETLRTHQNLSRREADHTAGEWLAKMGIRDPGGCLRSYPHEMSGGMNQRVVIAMAAALGPAVLIADEPTSALDVTVQIQILELLSDLLSHTIGAAVVISHDLGVIQYLADDVLVMKSGRVVESGRTRDVLTEPQHPYTRQLLRSIPGERQRQPATLPVRTSTGGLT